MAVTLNEIAKAAGVSRGTVDRALNNRGRIRPEVAEKIRKIADDLGYTINVGGRALAMSGRQTVIGIILQFAETPFIKEVEKGILAKAAELHQLGCEIALEKIDGNDPELAVSLMQKMYKKHVRAIILIGRNDLALRREIDACEQEGIPVITLNNDVSGSMRTCFVGQDAYRSGRVAASVMGDILKGMGNILIFYGLDSTSQSERVHGFQEILARDYSDIHILTVKRTGNSRKALREMARQSLEDYSSLDGIYLCAEGIQDLCDILKESSLAGSVRLIAHDVAGCRPEDILDRTIDYIIDDDGYGQGYQALHLLSLWIFNQRKPQEEFYYSDIRIINGYNLPGADGVIPISNIDIA